jgi:hypothetical protein
MMIADRPKYVGEARGEAWNTKTSVKTFVYFISMYLKIDLLEINLV